MPSNLRQRFPALPSTPLTVLLLLVFFKQVGNGMVWSVLAVYGQSLGASAAVVGLMISAFGGARLITNFPAGYASEKFGRKRMMSGGCVLLAISSFAIVATSEIGSFFVCLLIMGIASSIIITSALAAVADLGTPGQRVTDMSYYQAANMIGASMGPALGGLSVGIGGYSGPFLANGLVAFFGIGAFLLMPWPHEERGERPISAPGQLRAIARQGMGVGLMSFSLFYVRVSSNWILMPLIAQSRFGLDMTSIGLILTGGAIANLSVVPFTARLTRRFGHMRVIVIASIFTLIACGLLAFGNHHYFLTLSSIMFGAAGGIANPTLTAYVAEVAPPDQRGPAMGLLRTMQDLALLVGPFFTGLLSDHLGLGYQGGLFGCLALLTLATFSFHRVAQKS
jgi:MFS transporter, DHA1 family, multidrug resistance protein